MWATRPRWLCCLQLCRLSQLSPGRDAGAGEEQRRKYKGVFTLQRWSHNQTARGDASRCSGFELWLVLVSQDLPEKDFSVCFFCHHLELNSSTLKTLVTEWCFYLLHAAAESWQMLNDVWTGASRDHVGSSRIRVCLLPEWMNFVWNGEKADCPLCFHYKTVEKSNNRPVTAKHVVKCGQHNTSPELQLESSPLLLIVG